MKRVLTILAILGVLAALLAAPGCGNADGAEDEAGKTDKAAEAAKKGEDGEDEEQPVPVEVASISRGPIESVIKASATLEAERQVKVFSEATRKVTALLVEEGNRVRRGQSLVRLQDDEQRTNLAKVENQLAKAEREYQRQQRLYTEKLISEEQFNNATFELEQLRLSLEDAERQLGYTDVRAPIAGTVTRRLVNLGDQVTINQHLFDIVDFDSLVARIFVPEKNLPQLRPGLSARISTPASIQGQYAGSVDRVAPIVDAASGTVKVTVAIGGQHGLRPGMYVDVELVTDQRADALLVPKRALVYDDDRIFVYRLGEERRAERVLVRPKMSNKDFVEPADGLAEGDQVIVAGQAGLKDGALVSLPEDELESDAGQGDDDSVERASL